MTPTSRGIAAAVALMGAAVVYACDPGTPEQSGAAGGSGGGGAASAGHPGLAGTAGGALEGSAHWPLVSPKPVVRAVAVASRADDSIVVLAEGQGGNASWLSLRRARPGDSQPDLTQVWATFTPLTTLPWSRLSAAKLGVGVAVYYQQTPLGPTSGSRQGLLRFDAGGTLLPEPSDPVFPSDGLAAYNCELTPDAERVLLACTSGARLTLRACAATGSCSAILVVDDSVAVPEPPGVVVTDTEFQLFYEVLGTKHALRRAVVDRTTLSVVERRDLLDLPPPDMNSSYQASAPGAVRVSDGVLVAFGYPRQFGVWDLAGTELRLSTPDATLDDGDGFWVTGRTYGSLVELGTTLYVLETTGLGQLDVWMDATKVLRIDPLTLSVDEAVRVSNPSAFYSDDVSQGVLSTESTGLSFISFSDENPPSYTYFEALPGVYDITPLGIACSDRLCQVLLGRPVTRSDGSYERQTAVWSLDRTSGAVTTPTHPTVSADFGRLLSMTPTETVVAYTGGRLEVVQNAAAEPAVVATGSQDVIRAFPEGDKLRVFSYTEEPHVLQHRLLDRGVLTTPQLTDAVYQGNLYACDGSYFTIVSVEPDFAIYRMDPAVSPAFEQIGGFAGVSFYWDNVHCSSDRLFLIRDRYTEGVDPGFDYFVIVRGIDGTPIAEVPLPPRARPVGSRALGGRYYLVSTLATHPEFFDLTVVDGAGNAEQHELLLPAGKKWSLNGLPDVDGAEIRMVWTADDGTPYASIWRLPQK